MEVFQRQIAKDFVIERVNLTNATITEALKFKRELDTDIEIGYKNIIIDLTVCSTIDTAFLGVLVVTLKNLVRLGGSVKLVKQDMFSQSLLTLTGSIEIFELYDSLDKAITSINFCSTKKESSHPGTLNYIPAVS